MSTQSLVVSAKPSDSYRVLHFFDFRLKAFDFGLNINSQLTRA